MDSPVQRFLRQHALDLLRYVVFAFFFLLAANLAFYWGVREKTFWEKFWDVLTAGGIGTVFGGVAFAIIGTVGLVAGPIYGAIGVISFLLGGTGIGLGVGGIVHILINSDDYVFSWGIIFVVLFLGGAAAWLASKPCARRLDVWFREMKTGLPRYP